MGKLGGERGTKARQIIDKYVFSQAERLADSGQFVAAAQLIKSKASSQESADNMSEALDKIVFKRAYKLATGKQLAAAESLIKSKASSKARVKAMLEELGLI